MNMFDYDIGDVVECVQNPHPFYEKQLTKGKFYIIISFGKYDAVSVIGNDGYFVTGYRSTFVRANWNRLKRMKNSC